MSFGRSPQRQGAEVSETGMNHDLDLSAHLAHDCLVASGAAFPVSLLRLLCVRKWLNGHLALTFLTTQKFLCNARRLIPPQR